MTEHTFIKHLKKRKLMLDKFSETKRLRFFKNIRLHFDRKTEKKNRKNQFSKISIKVYNGRFLINKDCIGLPLRIYTGNKWFTFLVHKKMVNYPIKIFLPK